MENNNYVVIQGWMIRELKLKGNHLLMYAIIYGFSQDQSSRFTGSLKYIMKILGVSRPTVRKILKDLEEKNLIIKKQNIKNYVTFNEYYVNENTILGGKEFFPGGKEFFPGGSKNSFPYNTNKKKIIKENITKESFLNFLSITWKHDSEFIELFEDFITLRNEKQCPLTETAMKMYDRKFKKWGLEETCENISISLENDYRGIFPNNNRKSNSTGFKSSNEYVEGIEVKK